MRRFACLFALLVLVALPCRGQVAAASQEAFEAASLHPLLPGATPAMDGVAAALDLSQRGDERAPSLLSGDLTLFELLVCAYDVRDGAMHPAVMKQLPDWAVGERVHLAARLRDGATVQQMRAMLQLLLHERYGLVAHEEVRTIPVLLLEEDPKRLNRLTPHGDVCVVDSKCGTHETIAKEAVHVRFVGMTLDAMADQLGGFAWYWGGLRYGPVVNTTLLRGRFDGDFSFAPLMKADVAGGPTISDGVRHDLGLSLRKGVRALPLLVVDHVERPTFD